AASLPARAIDDELMQAQVGPWLLAPENGATGCRLTFDKAQTNGGYALAGADACKTSMPAIAGAVAWNIGDDGSLFLADSAAKVLIRFQAEEGSPWESEEGEPIWLLPALGNLDHVPTVASIAGSWLLQTPNGKTLCTITFSSETDKDGTPKLSPGSDCPADIAELKLNLWAMEGFGLVLLGDDGSSLSFDMRADGSFQKSDEEEGDPLLLVRKQGG
ncbi:MAG: AprI/Inh family metalloprotease inhibitor, partial [Rhizobiaceae bacterium]|nr:AprI/Inh family metalloprotease inhibitor [Rhizobiaceae bacterium]